MRIYHSLLGVALLSCLLIPEAAQAEMLPWLSQTIADPFSAEKKANNMILPDLKPENGCPGPPDLKHKLHFNEVVIASLCNSPDAKTAYISLLVQANSYVTNYAGYLPTVTATGSRSRTTTFTDTSKTSTLGRSYGVSAGLTLYDFGQREFKLESAEKALIAGGYSYDSSLQNMISTAMQGYFTLLASQQGVKVAHESEKVAKETYEAARLRHQIGTAPLPDELQAHAAYSQAQLSTQQAENQILQNRAALALLMGLSAEAPVEVAEIGDDELVNDPFTGTVDALIQQAKQKRLDLQASRVQIESAKLSLEALKRSDLATLSLGINAGASNNALRSWGPQASRNQSIGLSVSIPIFTGFTQTYNERTAVEQLQSQEESLFKSELGVEQNVWNSWYNYETSKSSWKISQEQLSNASLLKDVAVARYKEGVGTILDVLSAQSQYISALQSSLQSRYNLLTSRVTLVQAAGVLDLKNMYPQNNVSASSTDQPASE